MFSTDILKMTFIISTVVFVVLVIASIAITIASFGSGAPSLAVPASAFGAMIVNVINFCLKIRFVVGIVVTLIVNTLISVLINALLVGVIALTITSSIVNNAIQQGLTAGNPSRTMLTRISNLNNTKFS